MHYLHQGCLDKYEYSTKEQCGSICATTFKTPIENHPFQLVFSNDTHL